MCTKQEGCGFYNYLIEIGKIKDGQSCPKPEPENCPRYQYTEAGDEHKTMSSRIFRVVDVHKANFPISWEEMRL